MATFNNGFEHITAKLLTPAFELQFIAEKAWDFGQHGEFYTGRNKSYNMEDPECISFVDDIIYGKTFPKFCFEGINIAFKINNISRICLAQLTREKGFFCSESGDVKPLTQNLTLPMSIYANEEWRNRYADICRQLESLYIDIAEAGIPYMDARYIMPHCQTISLSYCTSLINWCNSCNSRTENNFADEINYVYRLMRKELWRVIENCIDPLSKKLLLWLFEKSDKKGPYTRDNTYNNDFERFHSDKVPSDYAHNDMRKSGWKMELERMLQNREDLLLPGEKEMITSWTDDMQVSYVQYNPWNLCNFIKRMPYYNKKKED